MANRVPLVIDTSTLYIKELPVGDNLDLTGSGIVGLNGIGGTNGNFTGIVTASAYYIDSNEVISNGRSLRNITSIQVSGISTLGVTSATNLTSQQLNVSGISTLGVTSATNLTSQQLNVSGISTFTAGPVFVGGGTSTGTASQLLQVTGGSYVSGNAGIGTTNAQYKLDVVGDINFTGIFYQNGSQFVASRWTSGSGTDIYRISNVGIGTTNPTSALFVVGDARVTGIVTATSGFVGALTGLASSATQLATGRTIAITGDLTYTSGSFNGTGNVTGTGTLANSGVSSGSYGSSTEVATFTVDSKGRLTAAGTAAVGTALTVAGDSGSENINLLTETLTISGGTNLTSSAASNTLTVNLDPSISLTSVVASGVITANSYNVGADVGISTTRTTVATTAVTTIDSFATATFRSTRAQVQITQSTNYQASDVLIIHDGTSASIIEYGSIATNDYLGTFSASVSGGNCLLGINMSSATSATVKVLSQRITV